MIIKHNPSIVNISTNNNETPLHNASLKCCEPGVQFLLTHKADVNRRTLSGDTCLSFAIRGGNKSIVKLLLEFGVDMYSCENAYQVAAQLKMNDVKTMVEQCQQFNKIRTDNNKRYKVGHLHRLQGKLKGWKKMWVVLDGNRLRLYNSEDDSEPAYDVPLRDIEQMGTTEEHVTYPHSLSITIKDNPTKMILAADDKISMARWILAIDGLKFKFFDSCVNQFLKKTLLHTVFKSTFKGGIIKSSFEEEWSYSSDGILQCTEAGWNTDAGASLMMYLWDGQSFMPGSGTHSLGWGKFNGFLFEWMVGDLGEDGIKVQEYYWEEIEREYLTHDHTMDWKWTRHFLTLKQGTGEWIVEGEVPEPVVFFLSLLRYSRLGITNKTAAAITSSSNNNDNSGSINGSGSNGSGSNSGSATSSCSDSIKQE
ncbi:hypothetical protein SAMD00019534_121800, partial [Acytostelium subglobosum LB1]|uniref:hypothetical protein n=1 Tax=Acytostelium subglobosum LB1 TaxID=1410327 RepID=UPI0006448403